MQFIESKYQMFVMKFLNQVSFSIRNLKRSTIKEYYTKEETKRKDSGCQYEKNTQKTLTKIDSNTKTFINNFCFVNN